MIFSTKKNRHKHALINKDPVHVRGRSFNIKWPGINFPGMSFFGYASGNL